MSQREFSRRALLGGAVAGGVASVVVGDQVATTTDVAPLAGGRSAAAPAQLLRASAITTVGDPWLPDGTHLRVNLAPRLGFPLHPFTAFRIDVVQIFSRPNELEMSSTHVWLNADLSVAGTGGGIRHTSATNLHYLVLHGWQWQWQFRAVRCCFVRLNTQAGSNFRVDVLDQATQLPDAEPTVLASRVAAPYDFGGTDITLLRIQGTGVIDSVTVVSTESPYIAIDPARVVSFGLPTGAGPWYVPDPSTDPATAARTRVEQGAAKRMGPPDRPDGAVVALTPADEVNRVAALSSAPSGLAYWLDRCFAGQDTPPVDAAVSLAGGPVAGAVAPMSALLASAVDPAVARHLGLATRVDPPTSTSECTLWLVTGLWLLPLDRTRDGGTLRSLLTGNPPPANALSALYTRYPGLSALAAQRQAQLRAAHPEDGWTVVPLMAPAVAAKAAPDRPALPRTLPLPASTWRVTTGERLWTQRIPLVGPAAGGMLGAARLTTGAPVSLHRTIQVGSVRRARAMVAHWDKHNNDEGAVTDLAVPGQSASWALWRADEFGRWSDRAVVAGSAPPVAGPPAPTVEAEFQPAVPDVDLAPRSPGVLRIRVGVPGRTLPGALPARDVIGPGGAPVSVALLTVDGEAQPAIPVPSGATSVTATVAVRPFGVGESAAIPVVARLADAAGQASAPAAVDRMVHDPRAYPPLFVAPTLLFSAERDPMGESEVGLEWSGGAWGYRVYLGDEQRLGGGTGQRCERAAAVWARAGQLTDRGRFALVTPKPLRAGPDGVVRFTHRLPGSLRNVQFVRVVPVTGAGVETAFETCGLTPVAVPAPDRPPAPAVRVRPRADGRVDVTITATGLRGGLAAPPEARLRRGRLANDDPEYVPVVRSGIPLVQEADGTWTATVTDGPVEGFPAFVRLTWLAEVRYPAEPHLPAGATPADSQVHLIAGATPGPQVSGWGPTSPPASTLHTPETQLVPRAVVQWSPPYRIIVTNAPVSHRYAIAPYQLVVHRTYPTGPNPTAVLPPVPITGPTTVVLDTLSPPRPLRYAVVVVDPLNRATPPVYVQ